MKKIIATVEKIGLPIIEEVLAVLRFILIMLGNLMVYVIIPTLVIGGILWIGYSLAGGIGVLLTIIILILLFIAYRFMKSHNK